MPRLPPKRLQRPDIHHQEQEQKRKSAFWGSCIVLFLISQISQVQVSNNLESVKKWVACSSSSSATSMTVCGDINATTLSPSSSAIKTSSSHIVDSSNHDQGDNAHEKGDKDPPLVVATATDTSSTHTNDNKDPLPLFVARSVNLSDCLVHTGEGDYQWCRHVDDGSLYPVPMPIINRTAGMGLYRHTERTHAGVEHCLANKSIVFVGDSRVRFQYISMATFLTRGEWMQCQDEQSAVDPFCWLLGNVNEKKFSNEQWNDWYRDTNAHLNGNSIDSLHPTNGTNATTQQQTEICDCYRRVPFNIFSTVENRYLTRHTPYGTIRVTYMQKFRKRLNIHKEFPPLTPLEGFGGSNGNISNTNSTTRCEPGFCDHPYEKLLWQDVVPQLQATHAVLSPGAWVDYDSSCELRDFLAANHSDIDTYYLYNPAGRHGAVIPFPPIRHPPTQWECNPTTSTRWTFLDRYQLSNGAPTALYWDPVHSLSALNRAYNHQWLDAMCGIPQYMN